MSAAPPLDALAPAATVHPDLHVYDVTLRDGIQAPGATLSPADAGDLAGALDAAGVPYVEAGHPARDDGERIDRIREACVDATPVGLAGADPAAVDAVVDAGLGSISLFAGGSDVHRRDRSVSALANRYNCPVSVHLHDDVGAAAGNAFAAAEAGAAQVHTTVDGLGPMAGNTALAPFATGMAVHHDVPVCTLSALPGLSERVAGAVGVETSPSAPVVGRNVFRYTTAHRPERARREPRTYEGFAPELVGRDRVFDLG